MTDDEYVTTPPPSMAQGRDVLADMMRVGQLLRAATRELQRITTGSPETWAKLIEDARIPMYKYEQPYGDPLGRMMGIPIVIDEALPDNTIRIGDRLLIRREPDTWLMLDLDAAMQAVLGERPAMPSL